MKNIKALIGAALFVAVSFPLMVYAFPWESGLKINQVGAWTSGITTYYIVVDREVGPEECKSTTIKVDLGSEDDSQNVLMQKSSIRALSLTAFTAGSNVKIKLKDSCLYGSPTIEQLWLHK